MPIALAIMQILLALHTAIGALWKFGNSEQAVPSLSAIPHPLWIALAVVELGVVAGLILPLFVPRLGWLATAGAAIIAAEMALFIVVHLATGHPADAEVGYWMVAGAFCALLVATRLVRRARDAAR